MSTVGTSGRLGRELRGSSTALCVTRLHSSTRLAPCWGRAAQHQRMQAARPVAALGNSKKYNKYKSRQDLEKDYCKEWEETTKMTEEDKHRPMTALTLLTFLPTWFKFYVVPGPIRFVWFFIWTTMRHVGYELRKRAVIAGAKLDVATLQRRDSMVGYKLRETALRRLHGKESILGPVQLMLKR